MHKSAASGAGPDIRSEPPDGGSGPRRGRGRVRVRDRLWARITGGLLATFLLVVVWSVGHALTVPGGGSVSERLAEWARDHYLGPVVTFGEWLTYQPPKAGGKPSFALTGPSAAAPSPRADAGRRGAVSFAPPPRLKPLAGKALPGEGVWRVLARVHGEPGHLRHLPAGEPRVHLLRGRHRLDEPEPAEIRAAARNRRPWTR